jgi:hypothetical protein
MHRLRPLRATRRSRAKKRRPKSAARGGPGAKERGAGINSGRHQSPLFACEKGQDFTPAMRRPVSHAPKEHTECAYLSTCWTRIQTYYRPQDSTRDRAPHTHTHKHSTQCHPHIQLHALGRRRWTARRHESLAILRPRVRPARRRGREALPPVDGVAADIEGQPAAARRRRRGGGGVVPERERPAPAVCSSSNERARTNARAPHRRRGPGRRRRRRRRTYQYLWRRRRRRRQRCSSRR